MKKTTVIFDFDGTVLNTNDIIMASWQHTFMEVTGAYADEAVIRATWGEPLELTMRNFFGGPDEKVQEHISIYRDFMSVRFDTMISLFPGMKELLIELKDKGCKLALVTSRVKDTTYRGLRLFDIERLFDVIITANDTKIHKPQAEPALAALRAIGSLPEEAVMLGDARHDIQCARNAGITSVLVEWTEALPPEERTGINKPDHILKRPEDLFGILESES